MVEESKREFVENIAEDEITLQVIAHADLVAAIIKRPVEIVRKNGRSRQTGIKPFRMQQISRADHIPDHL